MEMSEIFFHELRIPEPSVNLDVGSGSHARQTGLIMERLERHLLKIRPDLVLVPGDTNTTLATAITAVKLGIRVGHVEAGLRSGDFLMPEEINRKLTDHCSRFLFAPSHTAIRNLSHEGLGKFTWLTGDTMVDALDEVRPLMLRIRDRILMTFGLKPGRYVLVTLHRPSNTDDSKRLRGIEASICKIATTRDVIFPIHPRTRQNLRKLNLLRHLRTSGVRLVPPQGYIEALSLLSSASCLLTDSGGMQKESFLLRVPCVTLRSSTEWPETLVKGANQLLMNVAAIPRVVLSASKRKPLDNVGAPFGNGRASAAIVDVIEREI